MASTCYQSIADSYPSKPIFNLDFQLSKPPASLDATALGCAARFNLSPVNMPGLMNDRRFQGLSAAGQSLSSGCTADPSEEAEISDSDDGDLPSVRKIIARSKSIIDLTLDDDDDDDDDSAGDKNAIETASNLPTYSPRVPLSSLQKSPSHTADDNTTSSAAVTPVGKKFPWKNVPSWSPLYHKLQQQSTTSLHNPTVEALHAGSASRGSTEPESPPNKFRVLAVEVSESSPEIPETPAVVLENVRRGDDDHSDDSLEDSNERTQTTDSDLTVAGDHDLNINRSNRLVRDVLHSAHDTSFVKTDNLQRTDPTDSIVDANGSGEAPLEIAESFEQSLTAMIAYVSSLTNLDEDGPMMVDISKLTTVKILNKRSNASGVAYECALEPLWLAADLVEKAQMGRVCIRGYENGLVRAGRLLRLRAGKRKFSQM